MSVESFGAKGPEFYEGTGRGLEPVLGGHQQDDVLDLYRQAVGEGYTFDDLTLEELQSLPPDQLSRALAGYLDWLQGRPGPQE